MKARFIRDSSGGSQRHKLPTPRQYEVIQLVTEGKSMKEIAGILHITERTVAFHKYRVMEQLRLNSTAELIQFAMKNNIVVT